MESPETVMLSVKFLLFLAMEAFVFVLVGGLIIAGLYSIVRDKVRESRRLDQIAPEIPPTTL